MPPSKPDNRTILIFGSTTWKTWVEMILNATNPGFDAVFIDDITPEGTNVLIDHFASSNYDNVIFVSHHDSMTRDAITTSALNQTGDLHCIGPSLHSAQLAIDKRKMIDLAALIPGMLVPREFHLTEIERLLRDTETLVAAKHTGLTEGDRFAILRDEDSLTSFLDERGDQISEYIFQEFIEGVEYSVNVVRTQSRTIAFEPVAKSFNSAKQWLHPARRNRRCPAPGITQNLRNRLFVLGAEIADTMELMSLVEIEFIVDKQQGIWFLEVNPRLSATTRMVSYASRVDLFTELFLAATMEDTRKVEFRGSTWYTAEVPISKDERERLVSAGLKEPDFSFSSRATIFGATEVDLQKNILRLESLLKA